MIRRNIYYTVVISREGFPGQDFGSVVHRYPEGGADVGGVWCGEEEGGIFVGGEGYVRGEGIVVRERSVVVVWDGWWWRKRMSERSLPVSPSLLPNRGSGMSVVLLLLIHLLLLRRLRRRNTPSYKMSRRSSRPSASTQSCIHFVARENDKLSRYVNCISPVGSSFAIR